MEDLTLVERRKRKTIAILSDGISGVLEAFSVFYLSREDLHIIGGLIVEGQLVIKVELLVQSVR